MDRLQVIAVSRLLLDQSNARLGEEQPNQPATYLALARKVGRQLLLVAEDILEHGLDPTTLITVTPEGARKGSYRVIEGNRRVLALKVMETPSIVDAAFGAPQKRRLAQLSANFADAPISKIRCVVFDTEDEARHWIELRHTGANDGVGLVEWDSNEQDRYLSRHGGQESRRPAGQIIDFVSQYEPPTASDKRIFTTISRVIATPAVRTTLGIDIQDGVVYTFFPRSQILKSLGRFVRDFRSGRMKVSDVYYEDQRLQYVNGFSPDELPDPLSRLVRPVRLLEAIDPPVDIEFLGSYAETAARGEASSGAFGGPSKNPAHLDARDSLENAGVRQSGPDQDSNSRSRPSRSKPPRRRAAVIPSSCVLWIGSQPRINAIYHELVRLEVDQYANACAVLLRVFIELSADHHVAILNVIPEDQRRSTSLAKKLKDLAVALHRDGRIDTQLRRAIEKIADGSNVMCASVITFNQYVHNHFAYPQPTELCVAWDELQPFMLELWRKP